MIWAQLTSRACHSYWFKRHPYIHTSCRGNSLRFSHILPNCPLPTSSRSNLLRLLHKNNIMSLESTIILNSFSRSIIIMILKFFENAGFLIWSYCILNVFNCYFRFQLFTVTLVIIICSLTFIKLMISFVFHFSLFLFLLSLFISCYIHRFVIC